VGSMVNMFADPHGAFTDAMGMRMTHGGPQNIFGQGRSRRYSAYFEEGVLRVLNVAEGADDPAGDEAPENSLVPKMLAYLAALPPAPSQAPAAAPKAAHEGPSLGWRCEALDCGHLSLTTEAQSSLCSRGFARKQGLASWMSNHGVCGAEQEALLNKIEHRSIGAASELLQGLIASNDVVVFSALVGENGDKVCPYCTEAMEAMTAAGIAFHHQMVGAKGTDSRNALTKITGGVAKVPMAFVFGTWIGGYDESDTDGLETKPPGNGIMPNLKSGKLKEAYDKKDISVLPR